MNDDKFKLIEKFFKENSNNFPLGYQFIEISSTIKLTARIGTSKAHNSNAYFVSNYYKPTSLIFSNE